MYNEFLRLYSVEVYPYTTHLSSSTMPDDTSGVVADLRELRSISMELEQAGRDAMRASSEERTRADSREVTRRMILRQRQATMTAQRTYLPRPRGDSTASSTARVSSSAPDRARCSARAMRETSEFDEQPHREVSTFTERASNSDSVDEYTLRERRASRAVRQMGDVLRRQVHPPPPLCAFTASRLSTQARGAEHARLAGRTHPPPRRRPSPRSHPPATRRRRRSSVSSHRPSRSLRLASSSPSCKVYCRLRGTCCSPTSSPFIRSSVGACAPARRPSSTGGGGVPWSCAFGVGRSYASGFRRC